MVVEARKTPSTTGSPPAYRELLGSWDLKGRACGLEQHWMHLLLLASPVQTLVLQAPKWELKLGPPPALCSSASLPGSFFSSWFGGPATDCARLPSLWPVVFRPAESHIAPPQLLNRRTKRRVERANRVRHRATRSASHCGGRGPDRDAVTPETELLLMLISIYATKSCCLLTRTFSVPCIELGPSAF